jgi:Ca2+/Na+ antiporter
MWYWYLTGMVTGWLFVSIAFNVALVYGWIEILRRPRYISTKVYDYEEDNSGPILRSA